MSTFRSRRLYGEETKPLPVRRDPRIQLIGLGLTLAAVFVYAASAPVAIYYLAIALEVEMSQVLLLSGVSLGATLWIFQSVAFAGVGLYSSVLVLLKKAQIGAGWIIFGIFSVGLSALFLAVGGLFGAWLGVLAGSLVMGAGVTNTISVESLVKQARRISIRSRADEKSETR